MARPKAEITKQLEIIAERCGLSAKHLRTLHTAGMPLDLHPALAWLDQRPEPPSEGDSVTDLRREKIRLIRLQSEKAALELSIRRGEFISRAENEESDAKIALAVSAMLKSLTNDLPPLVYGKSSQGEIKAIMRQEFNRVQQLVADHHSAYWQSRPLEA